VRRASGERAGAAIAARLGERRAEIKRVTLTRVYAVSEPPRGVGPEYAEGLRTAPLLQIAGGTIAALVAGFAGIIVTQL
jgi:hypothetical protein